MTAKIFSAVLIFVLIFTGQSFAMTASESINNFAFNAARAIAENGDGSFFFSPYSIMTAFSMAYAGAENETAKEIEKVLGLDKNIHQDFGKISEYLEKSGALSSANRVWLREGLKLKSSYSKTLKNNYKSTVKELDMKNKTEKSRKAINNWVSDKTNGKIQDLLTKLEPETQMILTNAIYFKGEWASKFNKERTADKNFHSDGGKVIKVPMMMKNDDYRYAENDGAKIIRIPYDGGRFSMIAVLPPEDRESDFVKNFDSGKFQELLNSMEKYEVDLWLPKFRTEKRYEMKNIFEALGVRLAFSNFADFSGITNDEKLKIDDVIHKTFIEIDEEKTEAAAATAILMMRATAARPTEKPKAEFHADRPFFYFITDDRSGTILFIGRQNF